MTAGRGLSISGGTINADVDSDDLNAVMQVAEAANKTASDYAAQIGAANKTAEDAKTVADAAKSVADGAKSGMMTDGERSKLASVERGANAYALPKASTNVLGGVRVDGSTIVSVDGVISAHVNGGSGSTGKVVFPIGYVVMNTTGVDPAVDFGGTWRQLPSLGCSMFERIG